VPQNARIYFLKLPERLPNFPWFNPGLDGLSILLSTPALFLSLAADYHERVNLLALFCCVGCCWRQPGDEIYPAGCCAL
jgi:hypothetical protein